MSMGGSGDGAQLPQWFINDWNEVKNQMRDIRHRLDVLERNTHNGGNGRNNRFNRFRDIGIKGGTGVGLGALLMEIIKSSA